MTEILFLFAAVDAPAIRDWALVDTVAGRVTARGAGMPEARSSASTVLVMNGANVVTKRVTLPKRITNRVREALPMLLEDELAASGNIHVAVGTQLDDGNLVAVVDSDGFRAILEESRAAGHEVLLAVADYMLLGAQGAEGCMIVEADGDLLFARPDGSGGRIEASLSPVILPALLPEGTLCSAFGSAESFTTIADRAGFALHDPLSPDDRLLAMARAVDAGNGINLCQGDFAHRRTMKLAWANPRRTGVLLGILLLIVAATSILQSWQMNRRATATDQATWQQMRATFPGVRNISHFRAKIRQLEARGEDPFVHLSSVVFAAVTAQPGTSILDLQYDEMRHEMLVRLQAPGMADIEGIRNAIGATPSLTVSVRDQRPTQNGSQATIAVEVAP